MEKEPAGRPGARFAILYPKNSGSGLRPEYPGLCVGGGLGLRRETSVRDFFHSKWVFSILRVVFPYQSAIFLYRGEFFYMYQIVEKFILHLWSDHIKNSIVTQIDAKTKLQEFSLKRFKKLPIYKLISNTGPRHRPIFKVAVKLVDTKFYSAVGKSKKDAEQNAAIICLKNTKLS